MLMAWKSFEYCLSRVDTRGGGGGGLFVRDAEAFWCQSRGDLYGSLSKRRWTVFVSIKH